MSYRELKNFSEILKILGYPRVVSVENFRTPNFHLVLDILKWFVKKFDSEVELPSKIKSSQDRVELIRICAQLIIQKVNVKLNLKKLYQADGHAVQELLKLTNLLHNSIKESTKKKNEENLFANEMSRSSQTQTINKIYEIKNARKIASEITVQGADLFDMLTKEAEIREERNELLSMPLQLADLEQKLRESIKIIQRSIESINYKIDNVASDESNLDQKIEQKKQELDRQNKRFEQIQMARPQFQDEFDKLEGEFEVLYEEYITKFCSLVYLEDKLEEFDRIEQKVLNEQDKKRKEIVEQNQLANEFDDEDNLVELNKNELYESRQQNDQNALNSNESKQLNQDRNRTSRVKVFGSTIAEEKADDSFDGSFNLDDENLPDEEENSDLDSEDEIELMNLTNNQAKITKRQQIVTDDVESDEDF